VAPLEIRIVAVGSTGRFVIGFGPDPWERTGPMSAKYVVTI